KREYMYQKFISLLTGGIILSPVLPRKYQITARLFGHRPESIHLGRSLARVRKTEHQTTASSSMISRIALTDLTLYLALRGLRIKKSYRTLWPTSKHGLPD